MIRKVITAESNTIELKLPEAYVGRQIEIIIFSLDEVQEYSPKTFTTIQIDTKDFKFDREELNERWIKEINFSGSPDLLHLQQL